MKDTTLMVIIDFFNNGYRIEFLDFISIFALIFGIVVISVKNPVWSLISLIGLFGGIAIYLILIGLDFIGFSYLIVYIGAVSILFLFILMLINIRSSELLSNNINSVPLAIVVIILLNYTWSQLTPFSIIFLESSTITLSNFFYSLTLNDLVNFFLSYLIQTKNNMANIMFVASNNWDGYITETSHIAGIGMILYTVYNIWLLLASLILLLAMVGAIIITIK